MFVWFLKEKKLVPDALFDKDELDEHLNYKDFHDSSYYKAILQNLFFATLNTKMKKDDSESRKFVHRQYGVQEFYRYERFFKDKNKALKLFETIPFLNGGLFENLDKNIGKPDEVRIDCFSNRPGHEKRLKVPDFLFFAAEDQIDLSEVYGSQKRKNETVRGIIHILNSYKFTIAENTPIEEEIALDPELLGKVFENLLANYNLETRTTARKQTGSFYTPREIVNYMVDESLIAYLEGKLVDFYEKESGFAHKTPPSQKKLIGKQKPVQSKITPSKSTITAKVRKEIKEKLHHLLSYSTEEHLFSTKEVKALIYALDNAKILDPACGSGAFPMGILHKMVHILSKLDPQNKQWKQRQIENQTREIKQDISYAEKIKDNKARQKALDELEERKATINNAFDTNELDFGRKLYLIENCIFGVDIQPIAVQIAKLRFFISLIVDQIVDENKENLGIIPLPNLETKFVAANSLIGVEKKGQIGLNFQNTEINKKEKELAKVRERHFSARTPNTKEKYRRKDENLRNEIAALLEQDGFASEVTQKLAHWNPYDQNTSADFFDMEWMFGVKDGFDVVIGNPPYIKEYTFRNAFDGVRNSPYYQGKMDLWFLFACHNLDLLIKEKGVLTFIATNSWVTNYGASKMRNKIIKDATILKLLDFGSYMIFEHSDIQTMIMIFRNDSKNDGYNFDYRRLNGSNRVFNDALDLIELRENPYAEYLNPIVNKSNFMNRTLTFGSPQIEKITIKLKTEGTVNLNEKEVAQGIVCPQDYINKASQEKLNYSFDVGHGIFVIDNKEKQELNLSKKELQLIKPYYTTKELFKYFGINNNVKWIIYTDSTFKNNNTIKPYPKIKKHLDKFQKIITSVNKPYGLHRSRDEKFFKGKKIIAVRKCIEPVFTYTDFDCYVSATFYIIKPKRINIKYLTSLLNSMTIKFWFKNKGKMQGNNFQIDKEPLLNIPIKKVNDQIQDPLIILVDDILKAKKINQSADTTTLEAAIDGRVAHIYNLTEEEYALVLKDTDCPDPFRVAALNVYRDIARGKIK
ncbi:Eco57I restriction-modification methylase domain-containing protein [Thermodesulfobacteriota bacterium]